MNRDFRRNRAVLLPKDYVRLRMTGETASDMSDSAGTLWVDVAQRRWSHAMLAATGLDESHMPKLFEGNEITGDLRRGNGGSLGNGACSGGRPAAATMRPAPFGVGVVRAGDAFLSLGTSGVLFRRQRRLSAESRRRRAHLLPRAATPLASDGR